MAWRTWTRLSPEEQARRRKLFRLILLIQAGGLAIGGTAAAITALTSPSASGLIGSALPFLMVGLCWLVYRLSERHWYGSIYLYSFITVLLTISGMYSLGGAQGPMAVFFLWVIFTAGMLIDLRAAWEMVVVSLVAYGFFAVGQPLGWIKLRAGLFASTAHFVFPVFFGMMFVLIGFLTWLFGSSLNQALEQARQLSGTLEDETRQRASVNLELVERNRQLEELAERNQRRAIQLQTAAQVSNAVTQLVDPDELFPRVVELIRQRFDFYYVGLFLVDAESRYAVLRQGTGEAGSVMKEQGHRLEVGGQSMVGWACANQQARIALDVQQETVRYANPLLPDTRSEMALPIRISGRVLGALTVQSTQPNAFDQDDIAALQGMADQIAVALENARLFQQTKSALQELERTNRLLVREGWEGYLGRQAGTQRAEFSPSGTPATEKLGEALAIPLELRGQPIGQLTLRRKGDQPWSDEEIEMLRAIALQTVLAADNARLFEETQLALQETDGLFEATRTIAGLTQITEICQNLANYANTLEQADRTIVTLVDIRDRQILARVGAGNLTGELDMTFDELEAGIAGKVLRSGEPALSVSANDSLESEATRERRRQHNIGSLIVAPLTIKGQVVGVASVANRTDQRQFAQHDIELIMALAGPAATAIENVRLLEATQRRAERERLIRQITTRIRAASDTQGVLETTATELAQSMGVPRAIVRLTMGRDVRRPDHED